MLLTSLLGRVLQRQRRVSSARSDYMQHCNVGYILGSLGRFYGCVYSFRLAALSLFINYAMLPPVLAADPAILCP